MSNSRRIIGIITRLGIILFISLLPLQIKGYQLRFATTILMYIALAQAWNIIGGYTGYISLGLVGFVGLGRYLAGIFMTRFSFNFPVAMLSSAACAFIFAAVIGPAILKLKAGYFAIATFAISQVIKELINNLTPITGGGMGLSLPIIELGIVQMGRYFYYAMALAAVFSTILVMIIDRRPFGYGLKAIKEDEEAAEVLGINTMLYKDMAFAISAGMAALVGSIYAYWLTFIEPISMFDPTLSVSVIIMAMLGGAGSPLGAVIGALVVSFISELLWSKFLGIHLGSLGLSLILIVIFLPKGFMDLWNKSSAKKGIRSVLAVLKSNASRYSA